MHEYEVIPSTNHSNQIEIFPDAALQNNQSNELMNSQIDIKQRLNDSMTRSTSLRDKQSSIRKAIEDISSVYPELCKIKAYVHEHVNETTEKMQRLRAEKDKFEHYLTPKLRFIANERDKWYKEAQILLQELSSEQNVIINDLNNWKRGQQLARNGYIYDNNLDSIQSMFECLVQILWSIKLTNEYFIADVRRLTIKQDLAYQELISVLQNKVQNLLYQLVRLSFVIEIQPPEAMLKGKNISTVIRLLIGTTLGTAAAPPHIKASIVNEAVAKDLILKAELQESDILTCGTLVNNDATMVHNFNSRSLSAKFERMQLNVIKRKEKEGNEIVMDEKIAIAFQAQVRVADRTFPVFALSLPVTVITHVNQEPKALAPVVWDNAFAFPDRLPFIVPEKVFWKDVGEMLSMKFRQEVGMHLTPEALNFLALKACQIRNNSIGGVSFDELTLTWSKFAKEPLLDRSGSRQFEFTFWEWFYAILKVTKKHLSPLWKDGAILGFVDKKVAEDILINCPVGSFLIRFSDSKLGGVSIAYVDECHGYPGSEVLMLEPLISNDLAANELANRIRDSPRITQLWTSNGSIPKDQIFFKHYTISKPASDGYKPIKILYTVEGRTNNLSVSESQMLTNGSLLGHQDLPPPLMVSY